MNIKKLLLCAITLFIHAEVNTASAASKSPLPLLAEINAESIHHLIKEYLEHFTTIFNQEKEKFYALPEHVRKENWNAFSTFQKNLAKTIYIKMLSDDRLKNYSPEVAKILSFCIANIINATVPTYKYGCDITFGCCHCIPSSYRILQAFIIALQAAELKKECIYVSFGSGKLLQDHINLGALKIAGVKPEVHIIDTAYQDVMAQKTQAIQHAESLFVDGEETIKPYYLPREINGFIFMNDLKNDIYNKIRLYRLIQKLENTLKEQDIQLKILNSLDEFLSLPINKNAVYLAVLSDPPDNADEVLGLFNTLIKNTNAQFNILNKKRKSGTMGEISITTNNNGFKFITGPIASE